MNKYEKKSLIDALVAKGYTRTGLNILNDDQLYKLAKDEDVDMVLVCGW